MNSDCTMERCLFMNPNPDKCDVINCQWKTTNIFNAIKQAYDDGYAAGKRDKSITSNGWISVDDALPKFTGDVLVSVGVNKFGEGMHNEERVAMYNTVRKRFTIHEHPNVYIGGITHWMPLPKPPEVTR